MTVLEVKLKGNFVNFTAARAVHSSPFLAVQIRNSLLNKACQLYKKQKNMAFGECQYNAEKKRLF